MSKINPFSHLSGLTIQKHPAPWWRSANSAQWGPFNVLLCKGNTWCTCEVTLTERCYKWKAFLATLLLSAFVAGSFRVQAQTFNTIYSFSPTHSLGVTNYGVFSTNSDGAGS